jgi:hypothetical protein
MRFSASSIWPTSSRDVTSTVVGKIALRHVLENAHSHSQRPGDAADYEQRDDDGGADAHQHAGAGAGYRVRNCGAAVVHQGFVKSDDSFRGFRVPFQVGPNFLCRQFHLTFFSLLGPGPAGFSISSIDSRNSPRAVLKTSVSARPLSV